MGYNKLSIIIPIKDEEENIYPLAKEIKYVMESSGIIWECIWVDDGSKDNSLEVLKKLNQKDPKNRYISLSENTGQSAAIWVGIKYSSFGIIATLDGDGQNDPSDLTYMLKLLFEKNIDFVTGYRKERKDSIKKKVASKIANFFRLLITGKSVRDAGCSVRVFRKECVEGLPSFLGFHRFFPTMVQYKGFKVIEVPVNHRPRVRGKSKYNISNRLWVGILDLIGVWWFRKRTFQVNIKETSP